MSTPVYRRCSCVDPETGKQYGARCPQLVNSNRHGRWYFRLTLPAGRRELRKGGYPTATAARKDLVRAQSLLEIPDKDDTEALEAITDLLLECVQEDRPFPPVEETTRRVRAGQSVIQRITVGEWLDDWLKGRQSIRHGSWRRYESIVRVHLKPAIGHIRLDRLDIHHLDRMFADIREANLEIAESNALRRAALDRLATVPWKGAENRALRASLRSQIEDMPPFRQPTGPTSQQRVKSCLRAALNKAITARKITFNPATHVELAPADQPEPLMWTPERVATWRRTGTVPGKVMVWTPELTRRFLDRAQDHRLYALWYEYAHYGLRRGEGCGQTWDSTDLETSVIHVTNQLVEDGWDVSQSAPKTRSGVRSVAIDKQGNKVLRAHRKRQDAEREAVGDAWNETGMVFTREDGSWLQPGWVTKEFARLATEFDLPPVNLHSLRHGAATFALHAGASLRAVQKMLGHSDIAVTQRYANVLEEATRTMAEASAQLIGAPGGVGKAKKNKRRKKGGKS